MSLLLVLLDPAVVVSMAAVFMHLLRCTGCQQLVAACPCPEDAALRSQRLICNLHTSWARQVHVFLQAVEGGDEDEDEDEDGDSEEVSDDDEDEAEEAAAPEEEVRSTCTCSSTCPCAEGRMHTALDHDCAGRANACHPHITHAPAWQPVPLRTGVLVTRLLCICIMPGACCS